jgi:hypothetical protein
MAQLEDNNVAAAEPDEIEYLKADLRREHDMHLPGARRF